MQNNANHQLIELYTNWLSELKSIAPELLGNDYSNPYYTSIPENWFDTEQPRIMVVGEEGFGIWGMGKGADSPIMADEIEIIQKANYDYLRTQLEIEKGELNNSSFWRRFRRISKYGICCWTNIDKIHRLRDSNCSLSSKKRKLLHATGIKVLAEEINILNPTHIVFFGWYGLSLQHELPDVFKELYPKGLGDSSVWKNTVVPIEHGGRKYIFAYHPGYKTKAYEDKVLEVFCKTL